MRVFGEKDIEGVARGSVEGDERIVEFETTLRKKRGKEQATQNTKQRPKNRRLHRKGGEEWKEEEKEVEKVYREHRAPSKRRDPLPSIHAAYNLSSWIICKNIYFDFIHTMRFYVIL